MYNIEFYIQNTSIHNTHNTHTHIIYIHTLYTHSTVKTPSINPYTLQGYRHYPPLLIGPAILGDEMDHVCVLNV